MPLAHSSAILSPGLGGLITPGTPSGAVQFTGASSQSLITSASISHSIGTGDFTISNWVKANFTGASLGFLYYGSANQYYSLQDDATGSNGLTIRRVNTGANAWVKTGGRLTANTWLHLVYRRSSTTSSIWVNGSKIREVAASGDENFPNGKFGIGESGFDGNYFTGLMADVSFWNRALTDAEIVQMYTGGFYSGSPLYASGLLGSWTLRGRYGASVTNGDQGLADQSGSGRVLVKDNGSPTYSNDYPILSTAPSTLQVKKVSYVNDNEDGTVTVDIELATPVQNWNVPFLNAILIDGEEASDMWDDGLYHVQAYYPDTINIGSSWLVNETDMCDPGLTPDQSGLVEQY